MKKKTEQTPSVLDNVLSSFSAIENGEQVSNMDIMGNGVDIKKLAEEDVDDDNDKDEPDDISEENDKDELDTSDNIHDDDSEIPDDVKKRMNIKTTNTDVTEDQDDDISEQEIQEAQQVTAFFDAIAEQFGIDVDDDNKPVTVEEFTEYIDNMVNERSVPQYADDRVKDLDAYIKNGGKFEDFYALQQQSVNYDNIDIEDEVDQKAVIREFYKATTSMSDEKIARRIERLEDADMLEEEAEDALDNLKQIREEQIEQVKKQQELYRAQQEEQQRAFFEEMSTKINNLKTINGISVAKEDRKVLFDYIFKPDRDGKTQYQKDFEKNVSKNLIESAYYMMKGDELVSRAKQTGESSAANRLRNILRH